MIQLSLTIRKQNRRFRQYVISTHESTDSLISIVKKNIRLVVEIMDEVAVSGNNEPLLVKKLRKIFNSNTTGSRCVIRNMPDYANICFSGIIDHLSEKYPELTSKELEMCSMIALGIPQSGISMAYGYDHPLTIYNKRAQLRKKMNVPSGIELEEYFHQLAEKLEFLEKSRYERNILKPGE